MRSRGPEANSSVTSEQLFQMSYLADQYRQDGKPGHHRMAYVLEGSLIMNSRPSSSETKPAARPIAEPITVYEA